MTTFSFPLSLRFCLLLPWAIPSIVFGADAPAPPATQPLRLNIVDRAACSSLVRCKQSTDDALRAVSAMGFKWVDLACLNWAPHVSVPKLMEDFEKEAGRVEAVLKTNGLRVANLTFDGPDARPFDPYEREFAGVVKLAARVKARLVNIMAPSAKADRDEMVRRLRKLQTVASQTGVLLTVETHCDQLTERPADALWLCRQVPGLGLTLDPSHYFAGPNQGTSFDALYPLVQGTGFRAGGMSWKEIQLPWGQGPIDFAAVVRKLESAGYRGFYVAEYIEGFNELDAERESRRFLDWARQL